MRRISLIVLSLAVVLSGCKAKELADKAAIAKDLQKRGTMDLAKEVANDQYTPPDDGRLTEAQVQMYLKVREQEKKIAEVAKAEMKQHAEKAEGNEKSLGGMLEGMKALGSAAHFMTADIRAAKDLGYNSQEYLWVKSQILAASTSVMAEKFSETISANFDKAYDEAKKAYDEAKDEQTKKIYADMLAGYDKSKQEMQQNNNEDPALTYNRHLLAKYENALNAYAQELVKWADKPAEVQKSIDEFTKKTEEAKKE